MPISQDGQSYKKYDIYIHDSVLTLTSPLSREWPEATNKNLQMTYRGKPKSLFQMIDRLEKEKKPVHAYVLAQNPKALWKDFQTLYRRVNAGGGVVENNDEILCIYRRQIWDLPKGKLDPGETWKQAALREVMEETGLKSATLGPKLGKTLHTLKSRAGNRILKVTRWYCMTTEHRKFEVQKEEDIEEARWLKPQEFLDGEYVMFHSIRDVVLKFIKYKSEIQSEI
jgi:8-oxo-dGTP pyrophosphatase MutT (NUDIX family)